MSAHPNTTAAGLSGAAATLLVYLLDRYAGTSLNPVDASGIATALAAVVLFVGRRGIRGALLAVWRGQEPTVTVDTYIRGEHVAKAVAKHQRRNPPQKRGPKPSVDPPPED